MARKKKKLTKSIICSIILAAVAILISLAVIIANFFIPVKYLSAYLTLKSDKNEDGTLRVSFIDVGYGDSTLIELPDGKNILIDAGNGRRTNQIKILKFLQRRGIESIDYLVCSSVRAERCGGLAEILKYKTVGQIFMPYCLVTQINPEYLAFYKQLQKSGLKSKICEYGAGVFTESYKFCFLSPSAHNLEGGEYGALNADPADTDSINNASAVIWLECSSVSFLFCGDANAEVLTKIYDAYSVGGAEMSNQTVKIDKCTFIKAGNHGSANAVNPEIYGLLSPKAAIISVGENGNAAPSASAISALQNCVGDKLYRTDLSGTVTIVIKDGKSGVIEEKK